MKKFSMLITSIIYMAVTAIYIAVSPIDSVPSHWNEQGVADAFSSKWINLGFSAVLILYGVVYMIVHIVSSRYENGRKNIKYADKVIWAIFIMSSALFCMFTVASMLSVTEMGNLMPLAVLAIIGALMIYMGNLLPKLKQNGWLGIRTSATLSNETVWKKTHKFGGYCGVLAGVVMIVMAVWGLVINAEGLTTLMTGVVIFVVFGAVVPSIYAAILGAKLNNWE